MPSRKSFSCTFPGVLLFTPCTGKHFWGTWGGHVKFTGFQMFSFIYNQNMQKRRKIQPWTDDALLHTHSPPTAADASSNEMRVRQLLSSSGAPAGWAWWSHSHGLWAGVHIQAELTHPLSKRRIRQAPTVKMGPQDQARLDEYQLEAQGAMMVEARPIMRQTGSAISISRECMDPHLLTAWIRKSDSQSEEADRPHRQGQSTVMEETRGPQRPPTQPVSNPNVTLSLPE